jgi:glycosyltransferase involved in cell wall biosynthesis
MPVYNAGDFLKETMDSILSQTFHDFEFLIFNDGSTDNSREIILAYNDQRIQFFDDDVNQGYTKRLNAGLELAKGKYIARMDADDIALPQRFDRQYSFMESNPDIAVCGTFFDFTGSKDADRNFNWVSETDPELVKINLLFDCAICHPAVMIRNELLLAEGIRYRVDWEPSEDYAMWISLSRNHKLANIPDRLLRYRIGDHQVSGKRNDKQRNNKFALIREQLQMLHIEPTSVELRIHDQMFYPSIILSYDYLPKMKRWAGRLRAANEQYKVYQQEKFSAYLDRLIALNVDGLRYRLKRSDLKTRLLFLLKSLLRWNSIR